MSLLTNDARGRVTFVWTAADPRLWPRVFVVERSTIDMIEISGGDIVILGRNGLSRDLVIGLKTEEETDVEYEQRTTAAYESIVAEDVDIVWTMVEGGWIRVPDLA